MSPPEDRNDDWNLDAACAEIARLRAQRDELLGALKTVRERVREILSVDPADQDAIARLALEARAILAAASIRAEAEP